MRTWTVNVVVLACLGACDGGGGQRDPRRVAFEEQFPVRYCAFLETCGLSDTPRDACEADWAVVMDIEARFHPCYSPVRMEQCLEQLDPALPTYVGCEALSRTRDFPSFCTPTTWTEPCNYF